MASKGKILHIVISFITYVPARVIEALFAWYYGKGRTVPKVTDPILLLPAVALAGNMKTRKLRAEDVMSAYIVRAKEVNPIVNFMTAEQFDQALRQARDLDTKLDGCTESEREELYKAKPLLGVPLSVKEAFSWTGMGQTSGVANRKHLRAKHDAPVLANLKSAGVIPFIQSNVSEVCMWFESSNYVHGCTNNAYDTTRIVGGSSGGEGCIISSGASVIGIGSDIGGSIRMPCFFNGIFGHKPSIGVVSNADQFPAASPGLSDLLATGPMCRFAADLIPCLSAMAGSQGLAKLKLDQEVDLSQVKVITVPDDSGSLLVSHVDPQLKAIQAQAADYLDKQGASVTERRFSKFRFSVEMWTGKMRADNDGPKFSSLMSGSEDGQGRVNCLKELGKSLLGLSSHTLPAIMLGIEDDYLAHLMLSQDLRAIKVLKVLKEEILQVLGDNGVLLYPSHPKIAPCHSHPILTPFNFAYTALFNALGLPVTQVPLGLSRDGLPMGLQVVASPFNDHLTLGVARALEKGFGGWVNPGA